MYDLKTMVVLTRTRLKDLRVKTFPEFEIIAFLNEGKNALVQVIREASENFFEQTTTGTMSTTTSPNYVNISLPVDFAELRNIRVTSSGYERISFQKMNQSDRRFQEAVIANQNSGISMDMFYYDFSGTG